MDPSYNIPRCQQPSFSKHFKRLFLDTYWGGHSPVFTEEREKQLCINRDLMAEQYNLKKFHYYYSKFPKKYWKELIIADFIELEHRISYIGVNSHTGEPHHWYPSYVKKRMREWIENHSNIMRHKDHPEYYTDTDKNMVSVFSKYIRDDDTEVLELIEKSGYKQIAPIYNLDQKTFIKVIYKR